MENFSRKNHIEYFIKLIRAALYDKTVTSVPKNIDLKKIYVLAKQHSVVPTIYPVIKNIDLPTVKLFENGYQSSWRKNAVQFVELSSLISKIDKFKIDCIPLKGCILKDLYPHPEMRTMADLDFLFNEKKIGDIRLIMYQLGYIPKEETPNHYSFYKEPVMNVEFHPKLFVDAEPLANFFNPGLQYVKHTGKGKPMRKLTKEGFFIYLIAHLSQHFLNGGIGIRSVIDIWVYLKHYGKELNWYFINQEFKKANILDFSYNIRALAQMWFGLGENTPLLTELGNFIIKSGTYGTKSAYLNSNLGKNNKFNKNKIKYVISTFFPSYSIMKNKYIVLKKYSFLLPALWIYRLFYVSIKKRQHTKEWIKDFKNIKQNKAKEYNEMFARFGFGSVST